MEKVTGQMNDDIDVLMITYNRASYTQLSLERLLETCDDGMRVWVWHNGDDAETLAVVRGFLDHPRLHRFHHSRENKKLTEPTNWMWRDAKGAFLSKVDDDCLVPWGWERTLRKVHRANPTLGVIGCWRFPEEDFEPEVAHQKIHELGEGHNIMRNCWVEGSGYLMKRQCVSAMGALGEGQSFPNYCIQLARRGWANGWHYPFLYQEHFDDPRSPNSLLRRDEDMERWAPLSALKNGVTTVEQWQEQLKRSAALLQRASYHPKYYTGWRSVVKRLRGRLRRIAGVRRQW